MGFKDISINEMKALVGLYNSSEPLILQHGNIKIIHPTRYNTTMAQNGNDQYDTVIHFNDQQQTTYDKSVNLFNSLGVDYSTYKQMIFTIIEYYRSNNQDRIQVFFSNQNNQSHSLTIPNIYAICQNLNINLNENSEELLKALLLIGINDSCRYRNSYSDESGFINHMYTALGSVALDTNSTDTSEVSFLHSQGVTNRSEMLAWLNRYNIMRRSNF